MNCNIFKHSTLRGSVNSADVLGICDGVQPFLLAHSLANSDIVLTWDSVGTRVNTRRARACGNQACTPEQTRLRNLIGDTNIKLSCDEFPFAAVEEGGDYYTTIPNNPSVAQKTCVPAWQNTLQGNCNSESQLLSVNPSICRADRSITEILSNLQTNVAYFERQIRGDTAENWVTWSTSNSDNTWVTSGNVFNGQALTPQRLAQYPSHVPQSYGIRDTVSVSLTYPSAPAAFTKMYVQDYTSSGSTMSWMYKRNFTFGLASPTSYNDGASWVPGTGPAESWTLADGEFPVGTDGGDVTAIACAVNTFQQHDIFSASYNGLCFNGKYLASGGGMWSKTCSPVPENEPAPLTFCSYRFRKAGELQ